jgi:hypothetical protein
MTMTELRRRGYITAENKWISAWNGAAAPESRINDDETEDEAEDE